MASPVRASTPFDAATTVKPADWLLAAPSTPVPSTSIVWLPAVAFAGICTVALTTPLLSEVTVANNTGSEWKMICAEVLGR